MFNWEIILWKIKVKWPISISQKTIFYWPSVVKRKHEQCKLHNIFIMHKAKGCQFTLLLYNPDQFQSDEVMIHNVRSKAAVKLRCDSIKSVKCFIDIIYQRRRNALMQVTIFVVKKETYSTYFCNETCQLSVMCYPDELLCYRRVLYPLHWVLTWRMSSIFIGFPSDCQSLHSDQNSQACPGVW